ncbi:hypothetical protein MRB53_023168 [Persea americana]|uniref:Uncharacterized protein n=1 Tax=Persea americana TaxID=3435 RepID=A0ACC2L904_PERAE|nr:hypothetical protein MRB53_023168 [Persea americana]
MCVGCILVHGQIMVRGQVVFMPVNGMRQQSRRERMMKLRRREMAKNSLERYTHYYERWATNQSILILDSE